MPVSSLPSDYGIGDFGQNAFAFVDRMAEAGVKIWQILPLNPLGYGNSPYQPYSSMAGDEIYLGLDILTKEGLLEESPAPFSKDAETVDYEKVRAYKETYLKKAFEAFDQTAEDFVAFANQDWVFLYGVFRAFKSANNMVCWNEWEPEYKNWIKTASAAKSEGNYKEKIAQDALCQKYEKEITYHIFLQYLFLKQWMELKTYANKKKIQVMGDIPFYVGIDSLDVWSNQDSFLLDENGMPVFIAGVPPDYFSATGQRWGNPIYDWDYLKEHHYDFWVNRIAYNHKLFDIIRIDHFRAFDTYWKIPATCPTAIEGEWIEAPGYEVFDAIYEKMPKAKIVAEDLGDLRPEVHTLKNHYKLKGMKIIQFTFDPNENNNNFKDKKNMIAYTGTHDNQTILGWYESQKPSLQKKIRSCLWKMGYHQRSIAQRFVEYTLDNKADYAIIPMQDILELDDVGRLNTPGTVGSPNWEWKMADFTQADKFMPVFAKNVKKSGR